MASHTAPPMPFGMPRRLPRRMPSQLPSNMPSNPGPDIPPSVKAVGRACKSVFDVVMKTICTPLALVLYAIWWPLDTAGKIWKEIEPTIEYVGCAIVVGFASGSFTYLAVLFCCAIRDYFWPPPKPEPPNYPIYRPGERFIHPRYPLSFSDSGSNGSASSSSPSSPSAPEEPRRAPTAPSEAQRRRHRRRPRVVVEETIPEETSASSE
ncbi:hypothetical protein VTK56DRAFT_7381 [Thermocarpiscus australiensis]